jgi:hypothetical protein
MYVHCVLACLFSTFLAAASLCNGDVRDESDHAGARFGFSEQMSQVASTPIFARILVLSQDFGP